MSLAAEAATPTIVSLTFNDGFASQYDYARPVLRQYGVQATFYVSSNWVDNKAKGYMASWQLDGLYRDGSEIGGMGRDHKNLTLTYDSDPATDLAYKRDQVCGDRQRLAQLGYDPWSFAYPQGATNATVQGIVSNCGYLSGRVSGGLSATASPYAERIPPVNAYAVRTANGPAGPITLTQLQNAVTAAATHGGGWLPIALNQVCHQGDPAYSTCMGTTKPIDDAVLGAFLSWLRTQPDVSVSTVRSVMGAPTPPPLPPRPTLVSLTFDDGLKSQVRAATDILDARDVHATFFVNSGPIDRNESGTLTWEQLAALKADGHEIGGHTVDHESIKGIPYDEAYHQVCDDRARLIEMGYSPVSFAYPTAAFDAQAESIVQACGYQSGRTGGSILPDGPHYAETLPPRDAYATRALGTTYNGPITLQWLQSAVTAADLHGGGWVQILFHQVCFRSSDDFDECMAGYRPVDAATLGDFLDWIQGAAPAGVSVKTVAEAMAFGQ